MISPITSSPAPVASIDRIGAEGEFRSHLNAAREDQALQAARQLVATAFIRPALDQLSQASMASDLFKPGAGEQRMRPLLDAEIGDRIAAAPGFPLVDAVRERLLGVNVHG